MKNFIFLILPFLFFACSQEQPEQQAVLNIKFTKGKDKPAVKNSGSRTWGLNPAGNGDFECVGVFITYLNIDSDRGNCQDTSTVVQSTPHIVSESVTVGSSLNLKIPTGEVRIQVFGIDTSTSCYDARNIVNVTKANHSEPHIISDGNYNLEAGDQTISITTTFSNTELADTCTGGPFFPSTSNAGIWDTSTWDNAEWGP